MGNSNRKTTSGPGASKSFAVVARESLESIVVAFTLAFIFRAFIVEAFVIPTGSMAPTLYGQQVTHTCSTCGYEYAHGVEQFAGVAGRPPDLTLKCPNCGSTTDQIPSSQLVRPSSGDRILVHKWPFSLGGAFGPRRWGVTVFKDPHNGTINYIKRMVGKPGEFLEIIEGDIYTAPLDEVRKADPRVLADMDQLRRDLYHHAHGGPALAQEDVAARYKAINERIIPFLRIRRKAVNAPAAQESLWFNVYDRDFLPVYATRSQPESRVGWSVPLLVSIDASESGQLDSGRIPRELRRGLEEIHRAPPGGAAVVAEEPGHRWRLAAPNGDLLVVREETRLAVYEAADYAAWDTSAREIRFHSDSNRLLTIHFTGGPIDDFYGYNYDPRKLQSPSQERVLVGDLDLSFTWFPEAGDGGLVLEMNRDQDHFAARLQADGTVEIDHWTGDAKKPASLGQRKLDAFKPGKAVEVAFTNVDFRVSLKIDGEEVLASSDQQYAPNIPQLLSRNVEDNPTLVRPSQVTISGYRLQCRLDHLKLDRDVYYRSSRLLERAGQVDPGAQDPFLGWPGWGTQGRPIMLRDGEIKEYFMLGDNSPGSKDSRLWWEIGPHLQHLGEEYQVGTVPQDQLIGRAFFVYWPSGYRRTWTADIGAIPNFGRMRWIR